MWQARTLTRRKEVRGGQVQKGCCASLAACNMLIVYHQLHLTSINMRERFAAVGGVVPGT